MGLDNGIVIKRRDGEKINLPFFVKGMWADIETGGRVEIAYWRKCWGIRDKILDVLDGKNEYGDYPINLSQLNEIIIVLRKFLHKDYWESYAESIWEYDEYLEHNVNIIINLIWLESYIITEELNIEVYFYDSY